MFVERISCLNGVFLQLRPKRSRDRITITEVVAVATVEAVVEAAEDPEAMAMPSTETCKIDTTMIG